MRMKELNKNENLSIIGGYFPPSEEQLKNLNPIERIFICWQQLKLKNYGKE